jgi:hypothetical protein
MKRDLKLPKNLSNKKSDGAKGYARGRGFAVLGLNPIAVTGCLRHCAHYVRLAVEGIEGLVR